MISKKGEMIFDFFLLYSKLDPEKYLGFVQKAATSLLMDDEDENSYLENLFNLLQFIELTADDDKLNLNAWIHLAGKYHDHLKHSKAKTLSLKSNETNLKAMHFCLTFCFKNFRKLEIQEVRDFFF